MSDPIDLRGLFIGAKMWQAGEQIYNDSTAGQYWHTEKIQGNFESATDLGDKWVSIMVYPPQAYVLAYPLVNLPWKTARLIWWSICAVCFLAFSYALYHQNKDRNILLLILASSASFFALSLGQPMLIVALSLMLAIQFESRTFLLSGLFLGLAMIKFNLAIPFAFWFLLHARFKILISAGVTAGLMFGLVYMGQNDIISAYTVKLTEYYQMIYTFHPRNPYTFSDSELSMMLNFYFPSDITVWKNMNIIGQLLGYGSLAIMSVRKKIGSAELLFGLLLVSFIFSYHLAYDVLLFFIPLVLLKSRILVKMIYALVLFLALPINALAGEQALLKFNYPIILMVALILYIFALSKNAREERDHIAS